MDENFSQVGVVRGGAFSYNGFDLQGSMRVHQHRDGAESGRAASMQKQWIESRTLQLEEQKLQIQVELLELEKHRFRWERFSKKRDQELERMRMENERMKLENDRMGLELKQRELGVEL